MKLSYSILVFVLALLLAACGKPQYENGERPYLVSTDEGYVPPGTPGSDIPSGDSGTIPPEGANPDGDTGSVPDGNDPTDPTDPDGDLDPGPSTDPNDPNDPNMDPPTTGDNDPMDPEDPNTDGGVIDPSDDPSDPNTDGGTIPGSDPDGDGNPDGGTIPDPGTDPGTIPDDGTDPDMDPPTDPGDPSTDPTTDPDMDPPTDPEVIPDTDPNDPTDDGGTIPGMDPEDPNDDGGTIPGTDPTEPPGDTGGIPGTPGGPGCTYTQGYWKNHTEFESRNRRRNWPEPMDEQQLLCSGSALTLLQNFGVAPRGNAFYILSHQYIAAKLNVANGASAPAEVSAALVEAAALLSAYCGQSVPSSSAVGQDMVELSAVLDLYNNGVIGPGHCD